MRTMERVAEPAPALASTTSVPAFWMRSVSFAASSSVNDTGGFVCTHVMHQQHTDQKPLQDSICRTTNSKAQVHED